MATILAYGGSSVYGLRDPRGGHIGLLKSTMEQRISRGERLAAIVQSNAVPGLTFPKLVWRIPDDIETFAPRGRRIGIFMIGASDSRRISQNSDPVVNISDFRRSLNKLGRICAKYSMQPIFIGFPEINDNLTSPYPPTGEYYSDKLLQEYSMEVKAHADSEGAPFIDAWTLFGGGTAANWELMDGDGLHPNPDGYDKLFEVTLPLVDATLSARRISHPAGV